MLDQQSLNDLAPARRRSDSLHHESRRVLTTAIRRAAAAGHTQRQIAQAVGLSQPEVSRLLRFQPTSPRGHRVAARRKEIIELARSAGFANVRVFGSVARGDDDATSDIDLLMTLPKNASLFDIARLERAITELLGEEVDVVPDGSLQPHLADRVHAEAVSL